MSERPRSTKSRFTFLGHLGFIGFVLVYFGGLLLWFGSLFAGGGTEEHAVLGVVIPLVAALGCLAVTGFSVIALDGRRERSDKGS